ncbi:MAG: NAD-dependent succinate-semialdehyde dehydrogenase [Syntrophobacteraceae bacterium]
MKSVNPFNGKINKEFDPLPYEGCREAVLRAREAFALWRRMPVSERVRPIAELASILRSKTREYARLATEEMGKPIRQSITEVEKCALACDYYHENSERFLEDEVIETGAAKSYVTFEPLGVILGIMPWNFPFWQVVRWAVPTLAAGNVCLLKHASNVPITALEIEKIFREAGFPENVFQTLLIGADTTERIIEAELVDGVSLTGSVEAGSKVAAMAGKHLRKVVLELGGSDPFMVLEDADLEKAASTGVRARVVNAGQSCIAAKRFIVAESVAGEFVEKFLDVFNRLKIGDPMDEETDIGPLAKEEFLKDLAVQLDDAEKKGAVVHRGPEPPDKGFFFRPVVLTDVKPGMKVVGEEVFGPIAPIITVKSEEEMVRIANDTEFGLGASIWSRDKDRAERIAREIATGFVAINGMVSSDPRLPFGGVKKSGFGRELSHYGLREFVNIKTVVVGC